MDELARSKKLAVDYLRAALKALDHPGAAHDDAALAAADDEARRRAGVHIFDIDAAEELAWFIADYDRIERTRVADRLAPSAGCASVETSES